MKKTLLIACLVAAPALVLSQGAQNPNYVPSGPTPVGPGDPEWKGQTVQSGPAPSDAGGLTQARSTSHCRMSGRATRAI